MARGTATGNLVAGENVSVVVTGYIGRKAAGILIDAGVKIYTGAAGKVEAAFEDFRSGKLQEMTSVPEGKEG